MKYLSNYLLFCTVIVLIGCTSSENERIKVSKRVLLKKEIHVVMDIFGEDTVQIARIVDGDSTIFLYSHSTKHGVESSGSDICFYLDQKPVSIEYSPTKRNVSIISFGTGLAPNIADTVRTYEFLTSYDGETYRISGKVGGIDISGIYYPN